MAAPGTGDQNAQPRGLKEIFTDFVEEKIEILLCFFRIACVGLTLVFYLAVLGILSDHTSWYQKALIANAITSALRLHQRMPEVPLNLRVLGGKLVEEDSGHYLIYSLVFLLGHPVSLALLPPALFSLINSVSFMISYMQRSGRENSVQYRMLLEFYQTQRVGILQLIAMIEILLGPSLAFGLFSGHTTLFMPFVYYQFIMFRYASRRNPYSRNFCRDLRFQLEYVARHQKCPPFIGNFIFKSVAFLSSRAPQVVQQQ